MINTLDDARLAIEEIRHQGEGCRPLDPRDGDRELAHYYKFAEIVAGRHLVCKRFRVLRILGQRSRSILTGCTR